MGDLLAEIVLKNGGDLVRTRDGHITEQNIRKYILFSLNILMLQCTKKRASPTRKALFKKSNSC
jgi:hypothetical protein